MDTAPDFCGENVHPQIIENYDGKDVKLGESGRVLSVKQFPHLPSLKGRTLITTDGTTLLGADDKAGVAEICLLYTSEYQRLAGDVRADGQPDPQSRLRDSRSGDDDRRADSVRRDILLSFEPAWSGRVCTLQKMCIRDRGMAAMQTGSRRSMRLLRSMDSAI